MNKRLLLLFTLCLFYISTTSGQSPVRIDITAAIKSQADFKLSDLISTVELLTLKSNGKLILGGQPEILYFSRKYILMRSEKGDMIGLYHRNGILKTSIGRRGKGPGEYVNMVTGTIDPLEKHVVLYDQFAKKLIVFDIAGKFLREKKVEVTRPASISETLAFINPNTFGLMIPRPSAPTENYSSIRLFNLNLESKGSALHHANDSHLVRYNTQYSELIQSPQGTLFWEAFNDTVYRIKADGATVPIFYFDISKNKIPESIIQDAKWYDKDPMVVGNYTTVSEVFLTPKFVIAMLFGPFDGFVFTEIPGNKTFSTSVIIHCKNPSANLIQNAFINNDLYGFEMVSFDYYSPGDNALVGYFPAYYNQLTANLDCVGKLKVRQPEVRDALLSVIREELYDDEVVLIIHHVK